MLGYTLKNYQWHKRGSRHTLPVFHSDLYEAYVHSNLRCMDEDLFVWQFDSDVVVGK